MNEAEALTSIDDVFESLLLAPGHRHIRGEAAIGLLVQGRRGT